MAALRRHQERQPAGMPLVMGHTRTKPWHETTVRCDLRTLTTALGVAAWNPHAGRRGLSSYLLDCGVPAPVVASLLGNTPGTVMAHYAEPLAPSTERARALIEDLSAEAS